MKHMTLAAAMLAAAISLAIASPAPAQAPMQLSAAESTAVADALSRGKLIHTLDMAAWHSTDAMVAKAPKARLQEVRGWIVELNGDMQVVTYFGLAPDGAPYAVYVAEMRGERVVSDRVVPIGGGRPMTPVQLRMVAARGVATASPVHQCSRANMNTVVIPPALETGPVEVYVLTPQVKLGEYPFGGHTRFAIGSDGKVADTRTFTRSCLSVSAPKDAGLMFITHLMDPTPTEIHAWIANWSGRPVMVGTSGEHLWEVTSAAMTKTALPKELRR